MKTVQSGAHYTTVTVDTAEEVKFSFPSTSLSVEAAGGDITVALTDTAQAGDDETITVPDGESRMFIHHRMNVDTYYLTGSGTATLYASNMGDINPFKGGKRGGDGGGDNTHYKGTTTTPLENGSTTNPITIDGESYTAVFGDVVVYGYTEFVFDGTQWSEFGRPFDTAPTQGSTNAVTSDGVYNSLVFRKGAASSSVVRMNLANNANGIRSMAIGYATSAPSADMAVIGKYNNPITNDLFEIGNGTGAASSNRSNILEVSETDMNVNGDIKINNVAIPTPYTTMPTITADMLGKIAMYVGATGGGYVQGCFYIASTDGASEPTYSWVQIGGIPSDDYTTTERKIGKWIDGSDMYQRTFEVTSTIHNDGQYYDNVLGTSDSGINIVDFEGFVEFTSTDVVQRFSLHQPFGYSDYMLFFVNNSDLTSHIKFATNFALSRAVITIKYTKPSAQANALNTNTQASWR